VYSSLEANLNVDDLKSAVETFRKSVNAFGYYVKMLDAAIAADIESRGGNYVRAEVAGDEPHGVVYGQQLPVAAPPAVVSTDDGDRGKVFEFPTSAQSGPSVQPVAGGVVLVDSVS
jgi:hypothetical protein